MAEIDIYENNEIAAIAKNTLFGNYSVIILAMIVGVIALIALCRASYYKWMAYTAISGIIASIFTIIGLKAAMMIRGDFVQLFKNAMAFNLYVTATIMAMLSVVLLIVHRYYKTTDKKDVELDQQLEAI